ncbi:Mediator of RNA polymerase II transcription subunit 16 [Nymphon striatum]|nr:Mediator of RNA polymerase II transcription subunit 16 [Nymphon striatum]
MVIKVFTQASFIFTRNTYVRRGKLLQAGAIFSLSSRNTVVFTSHTELDDRTGISYQCHVYVADLNLPWKAHKITSHSEEISCLEWDSGGNKILFADITGTIQIWSMKDYVLNDWTQMTVNYFSGENFLCAAWFHNGKKIGFNSDTKDSLLYMEKFVHTKFSPTLRNFGGPPSEGCVFLSSSGMVCVVIFSSDSTFITGYDGLGPSRHMLKVVDLCHAKNGDFLVVTSDGQVSSPIHCYQVAIKLVNDKCSISSSCLPSFYLNSFTGLGTSEAQCSKVSHVKFVVKEAADAVVVASSGTKGSNVELWVLKEKPINFHKLLTSNNESNVKTVNWQHNATASSLMEIVAVTMPSCSIYEPSPMPSFVIISHKDGTIKCYYRESLQLIYSVNANDGIRNEETNGYGNSKTSICDLHLSHTGSILMAMDSQSQFYLYRLPPVTDPSGSVTANYIVTLLEYCIITGIDWWDVVIGLRSSVIDSVCECLSYSFNQQPQSIQTF